jgi:hypothetical protein
MNRIAPLLALALASGCSPVSLSGNVIGTGVGNARTAVFDSVSYDVFGFTFEGIVLLMSDIPDSCEVIDDFTNVRPNDCVDQCADLGSIGDEYLGRDEYWWSVAVMNPYDDDTGVYAFDDSIDDAGDFTSSFSALDMADIYNTDACEEICRADDEPIQSDDRDVTGGTVTIDTFENNAEMKGSVDLSFPGDETISGKFKAEHCDLEDFIIGLIAGR